MHVAAGYAIAGLVAARVIVWGFIGPPSCPVPRASCGPRERCSPICAIVALLRAPRYLGHNPAGGAMIIALLATLTATCITGYMMTTDAFWGSKWIEEVHETSANLVIGLIVVHVLGVLIASFEHRENLVKAMITGRKEDSAPPKGDLPHKKRRRLTQINVPNERGT